MVTLRQFRDQVQGGWPRAKTSEGDDKPCIPNQVWIDAGYMTNVVYQFCRDWQGQRFRPTVGRGAAQQKHQRYNRPTSTGLVVKHISQGFHINFLPAEHLHLVEIDADYWKTWVHQRLATPKDQPGAMTFYQAGPNEHLALAKHLTAEAKTEEFITDRGVVTKWERVRRNNHWFDALYNAAAAGYLCGVRLLGETKKPPPPRPSGNMRRPDGRPWVDLERWRQHSRLG